MTDSARAAVVGVLLAGGLARRMGGGDKCLRNLGGRPLIDHVFDRIRSQVPTLIINANGDEARFGHYGLPVVRDVVEGFAGPLAGVLTGMEWAVANVPDARWIASFATDTPFAPKDLVIRMITAVERDGADIACAASGGRLHPVFALWPVRLKDDLRRYLVEEEMRKVDAWMTRYRVVEVEFPCEPIDPFFNVNRPEDLEEVERMLGIVEADA